jgi:hypothetical protein
VRKIHAQILKFKQVVILKIWRGARSLRDEKRNSLVLVVRIFLHSFAWFRHKRSFVIYFLHSFACFSWDITILLSKITLFWNKKNNLKKKIGKNKFKNKQSGKGTTKSMQNRLYLYSGSYYLLFLVDSILVTWIDLLKRKPDTIFEELYPFSY